MYSVFMDHIVNCIPEKWIEKSGGYFIRAISKLYHVHQDMSMKYAGISISSPWGLSSGWADSLSKMNAVYRLGAGVVISKTITLHPRKGNPYPRIIRNKPEMINSMGLPNDGLKYWVKQLNKVKKIPPNFIFSLHGETVDEWNTLISKMKVYDRTLELNFSCPNVAEGVIDLEETKIILENIKERNPDAKMFLKISPQYTNNQLLDLLEVCIGNNLVQGISLFNTYPVKNIKLGNPTKSGGLSGPSLYPRLIGTLKKIRTQYKSIEELPIFAIGGISSYEEAKYVYEEYQALPFILTSFLMQGPLIFKKWWGKYQQVSSEN